MRCRKNRRMFQFIVNLTGQHIYFCNSINLISKEFHTNCPVRIVGREDFQHISTYPERTTMEIHFITVILNIDQFFDYLIPVFLHSRTKWDHHIKEFFRCTQTIDTGYRGNHNNIFPFTESRCCRKTEFIDFIVRGSIFCYISIRRWNVCLRLVIIIIGDKVFHCVLREEFLHLSVKLRCQCFIVRKYQSWFVKLCDDVRHGEGLTGTCDTQQSLELVAFFKAFDQFFDCLGLVTGWFVFGMKLEDLLWILHKNTSWFLYQKSSSKLLWAKQTESHINIPLFDYTRL